MSRTRIAKGVSTTYSAVQALSNYPGLDVAKTHEYFNDFDNYLSNSGEFVLTVVGTGAGALAAGDGGILALSTSAGATDSLVLTKPVAAFGPVRGSEMWFEAQLNLSDAINSKLIVGLTNMATVPFTLANLTDGAFFYKATGATAIAAYANGSSVSQINANVGAMVNSTYVIFGISIDVNGNISFYINDNKICTFATTAANFPAVNLTPIVAIMNGAAAIKVLNLDYIMAAKFRA